MCPAGEGNRWLAVRVKVARRARRADLAARLPSPPSASLAIPAKAGA